MSHSGPTTVSIAAAQNLRRRALRRAAHIECAVQCDLWDGPTPLLATDVSGFGLWLATDLPLDVGEELLLTFRPPRWPDDVDPVTALAQVVRVGMPRRQRDTGRAGMGLAFEDIDPLQSERMSELLRGLPPPLPKHAAASKLEVSEVLVLDDGTSVSLSAEGPLLTGGRALPRQLARRMREPQCPGRRARTRSPRRKTHFRRT